MDIDEIRLQAKKILDNFSRAIEKVKVKETKVERKEDRREEALTSVPSKSEGKGNGRDEDFREIMFSNAKETKDDCIIGEKGEWEKS